MSKYNNSNQKLKYSIKLQNTNEYKEKQNYLKK